MPGGGRQRRDARSHRLIVQMHGARAAGADTAAELGARQADKVADHPKQRHLRIGIDVVQGAVDLDLLHMNSLLLSLTVSTRCRRTEGSSAGALKLIAAGKTDLRALAVCGSQLLRSVMLARSRRCSLT